MKFGVHEIVLTGDNPAGNPFDMEATVKFFPPSGESNAKTVQAFYDGNTTWRARVYVSEPGEWRWTSRCTISPALDGKTGTFQANGSALRGRLLPHVKNPRQWMTEDGRWYLNLNDTGYAMLGAFSGNGDAVPEEDFRAYVRDAVERGITSFRGWAVNGPGGHLEDGRGGVSRWRDAVFDDDAFTQMRLPHFRTADARLRWMLEEYPGIYMQLILFPRGARWSQDDQMWVKFTPGQKTRVMRYMIARFAAFPQVFWLVTNDAHYGDKHPNNNAFAREVGEYFRRHDPWQHPMSAGHARKIEYAFGGEAWSTYVHLEENFDLGATQYAKYHQHAKPVFLGEDRYEQDHPHDRDPKDMRYFQRRLFWAWLLTGGSANYGGRWWVVHPYSQTGGRPTTKPVAPGAEGAKKKAKVAEPVVFTQPLTGLDSVKVLRDYFSKRTIELSDFEPDHARVKDADGADGMRAPKAMRRGQSEFLIYHPNAAADDRTTRPDDTRIPGVSVDLSRASGTFLVEWYRARDGVAQAGETIVAGRLHTLRSPWRGEDVVIRLLAQARSTGPQALPAGVKAYRDLHYTKNSNPRQTLDLYVPGQKERPVPVVVWVHGGAWQNGNKNNPAPLQQGHAARGYAIASLNYRLSGEAIFPAQIEDCKAAIRWLRANAASYGLDPERIAVAGSSAGGHLVALLGTTGTPTPGEFDVGENREVSSRVQAVIDYYGPTDFRQMDAHGPTRSNHNSPTSPESRLIGGAIQEPANHDKVRRANPITYVSPDDPPFLMVHGDADPTVPHHQSELLYYALVRASVPVHFVTVKGGGHGRGFPHAALKPIVEQFLDRHLRAVKLPSDMPRASRSEIPASEAAGPSTKQVLPVPKN